MPSFGDLLRTARGVWKALPIPMQVRRGVGKYSWKAIEQVSFTLRRRSKGWDEGKLYVAGFFSESHGIAASAIRCANALEHLGYPVERIDLGPPSAMALLNTQSPPDDLTGTYIIHVNAPEFSFALAKLGLTHRSRARVIGYWAWELPKAPESWIRRSRLCHEIWVPSQFVADAMAAARCPVHVVPHPLPDMKAASAAPCPLDLPADAFVALSMLDMRSSLMRKNPIGAIRAFRQAFPDKESAMLVIKTQRGDQYPDSTVRMREAAAGDPRILITNDTWSRAEVDALIQRADVFLSLHRAEGFGLVIAETMQRGKPVIATAWSGNIDFMSTDYFGAVPVSMVPVEDQDQIYAGQEWAEPDIAIASRKLKQLFSDPDLARKAGEDGLTRVTSCLGLSAYEAHVRPRLATAYPIKV
ncbi:MAG: glycosyltransferase family 4 protein [Rhodobacterales bacterium]|nr:glycosyltransferase family 4 protein [Rhodobacterales bacterium]